MSDEDDGPDCPICGDEDENCEHLVLRIDVHGSLVDGGEFMSLDEDPVEKLDEAVIRYIRREPASKDAKLPVSLCELVPDVRSELGKNTDDPDATIYYAGRALRALMDEVFTEACAERTRYEFEGGPGMSSTYISFWDPDATEAAERAAEELVSLARQLRADDDPLCPVCEIPSSEGCGCNPLSCPFCGKIVGAFSEGFGVSPCPHMVAWGTTGNGDVYWQSGKVAERFSEYRETMEDDDDETLLPSFAEAHGLVIESHDDGEGHGFGSGAFYVFDEKASDGPKKKKVARKAKRTPARKPRRGRKASRRRRAPRSKPKLK